ncbi:MAG: transcriptional repressor [Deltaproteobacteria bacterium]|nr:MAG: transcriptional repressor [Deltaproteobacteria bacterium]TMA42718.1 MAG: transcriptional repressor [Deltaproteobacteria bacterium]TMA73346.1 MAG: transcriptional repressor [Deltaproteobacteria bacterium]TMB37798.1 MAG: transcriptional repressor [Deltaproteobacteria bacterium]
MKRSERKTALTSTARERLASWIASRGLKATRQRDLIVDTFFSQTGHLSVDELVEKAKQRDPSIGAATVYRTMKILTDAGLASARHFEGGQTRYEAALDRHHHDHLICTSCGNIAEFENERIEELQDRVAGEHGFTVTHHKLELYGLCAACQQRQSDVRNRQR